jgi:sigma-B regulation protein RsbU (phosphoserine phosphatase)
MKAILANAGHPLVLFSTEGRKFKELKTTGSILGYNLKSPIATELVIPIKKGDRFFVYTDGLTDYLTKDHKISIVDNLENVINNYYKLESEDIIKEIPLYVGSLPDFHSFRDDIIISIIEVL